MKKNLLFLLLSFSFLISIASHSFAQHIEIGDRITIAPEQLGNICTLDPTHINAHYKFAPDRTQRKRMPDETVTNFEITYINGCIESSWSDQAKTAFEYAADIWADHLQSDIPIRVEANWTSLGDNTLGSAGPTTLFLLIGDGIVEDTYYTIAQSSALIGEDLVNEYDDIDYDIVVNINCDVSNWYFETDANPPANTIDLVTVILHEIGHGIGFVGSMRGNVTTQTARWGLGPNQLPIIYDVFALDGFFDQVVDESIFPNSTEIYDAVTGKNNGLFFSGTEGEFTLDGDRVPLHAPNNWSGGSSFSHLDLAFFTNTENALMRPSIDDALAIHSPGPLFCGMLYDIQWPLGDSCLDFLTEDTELERPVLTSPLNGLRDVLFEPDLFWNEVEGAVEYQFQLAEDFNFENLISDETGSELSFSVQDSLASEQLHFWRVKASDSNNDESNWSATWRFTTTVPAPDFVSLSSPEKGETNIRPGSQLSWNAAERATTYFLQISTDTDFSNLIFNRTLSTTTFSSTHDFDFSTTYYWRVKAANRGGETDWSEIWNFNTIIERPVAVDLSIQTRPLNQVSVTPELTWEVSDRASEYEIQVSESEDFSSIVVEGNTSETFFTISTPLEFATIYYWRVNAINIGGESGWSEPGSFTTQVLQTEIAANYPNPFNPTTTLRYQLSDTRNVLIEVYDIIGRKITTLINEEQAAGVYFLQVNASGYASGTYLVRFIAGDVLDIQKMTVIK